MKIWLKYALIFSIVSFSFLILQAFFFTALAWIAIFLEFPFKPILLFLAKILNLECDTIGCSLPFLSSLSSFLIIPTSFFILGSLVGFIIERNRK